MSPVLALLMVAAQAPDPTGAEETIVVTAVRSDDRVLPPTTGLDEEQLVERQPQSVAEALRGLAGVIAQTNSRGETIARIRGSEERQTQLSITAAADNLLGGTITPQLGLPLPGRSFRLGLRLE